VAQAEELPTPDGVLGLTPVGDHSCFVVKIPLQPNQKLTIIIRAAQLRAQALLMTLLAPCGHRAMSTAPILQSMGRTTFQPLSLLFTYPRRMVDGLHHRCY